MICAWLQHVLAPLYIKPFFFFFLVLAPTSDGTVFPTFLSLNYRDRKYSAADQPAVWLFGALEFTSGPYAVAREGGEGTCGKKHGSLCLCLDQRQLVVCLEC